MGWDCDYKEGKGWVEEWCCKGKVGGRGEGGMEGVDDGKEGRGKEGSGFRVLVGEVGGGEDGEWRGCGCVGIG